jgi:hypothetical protein
MLWHKRRATREMGRNILSGRSQRVTFEIRHSENLGPSRLARPSSLAQLSCASRYCAILLIVTLALAGFHCWTSFLAIVISAGFNCLERRLPCRLASSSP